MSSPRTRRSRLVAFAAIPLLLCSLSACAPQPPEGGTGENAGTGSVQWRLDFAECMRSQGIDMKDPAPNGAVQASGPEDETPERQAATAACLEQLGSPPVQSGENTEQEVGEDQLHIAQCLRDQGLDVADPAPGGSVVLPENLTAEIADACGVDSTGPVTPQ